MIMADSERADPLRILIQYQKNELPISPALEGTWGTLTFSSIRASCFLMEEELFKEKNKIDFSKINHICMASPSFTITQLMANLLDPEKHGVIDPSLRTKDLSLEWQHFFEGCKIAQSEGENAALTYLLEYPSFFFFQSVYVENEGAFNNQLAAQLLYFEKLESLRLSILFTYCCANQKATKKLKNLLKKQRQYVQRLSSST
ncbi:MAG: hypothetical protein EB051_03245 [Chlamydiia bacterium]|nr:hypothetical protein [Chlamydiia bacterium]